MAPTIIGNTGPVYQGYTSNWQAREGVEVETVYRGSITAIEDLATQFRLASGAAEKDTVRVSIINGRAELRTTVVTVGADGGTIDKAVPLYEMEATEVRKRLEQAPYWRDGLGAQDVLDAYRAYDRGTSVDDYAASTTEYIAEFYEEVCKASGEPEYLEFAPVLREIIITTKRSTVRASYLNVGRRHTNTQLRAKLADNAEAVAQLGPLPTYVWLKKFPRVTQYGRKRWRIVTEYWGADEWNTRVYPTAT